MASLNQLGVLVRQIFGTAGRAKDAANNNQINPDWYDRVDIETDEATLATGVTQVTIKANNDLSTVTAVWPRIEGKAGTEGLFIPQVASLPTWAAYMRGAIVYNLGDNKLYVATNAAWVVVGTQT